MKIYFCRMDTHRTQGMRRRMVEELQKKGLTDEKVASALLKIPRHQFLDKAFLEFAYEDKAFQIGAGQTISHPSTVGMQSQFLQVEKRMKVLEIGTGCGYQTAVLCEMGAKVYSIERQRELHLKAKAILSKLGYRANLYYDDGFKGKEAFAPFDRIIVTCGAPHVPESLKKQLKIGGLMVIPVGNSVQDMIVLKKNEDGFSEENKGEYRFVPMLEDKNE